MRGTFSFAVAIAIALAAFVPTSASATAFVAATYPATIAGEQFESSHVFAFDEGKTSVTCKTATFSGEISVAVGELSLTPSYSSCTLAGFAATVSANGCSYRLHAGEEVSESKLKSTLDLTCPAGKALVVKVASPECEVQIGSQNGLGGLEIENRREPEPAKIRPAFALTGIKYTKTKDAAFCPLNGTGEKADGTYAGSALLAAAKGAEAVSFGDGTISITLPAEVKFDNVNEEKPFTIENSGTVQWLVKGTAVTLGGTGAFTPKGLCTAVLKKGEKCTEKVVCDKPGTASLSVAYTYGYQLLGLKC